MAKKLLALVLAMLMVMSLASAAFAEQPSDEELAKWAEENGYVKLAPDLATSATEAKQGGVNYGAIEWSSELQEAAIKEWLKGGPCVADPAYAQDETGWSYRNMFQMATCYNNIPNCTNLELVLDAATLNLLGISEAGTSKIQEFQANPAVSIAWSKQLRDEDIEAGYDYFGSYGLTFNGNVKVYSAADLETEEGQNALINLFDKYYITHGWAMYSAKFADAETEEEIRAGKLEYITNAVSSGANIVYEIVPTKIIITCPFILDMVPQMANALTYATAENGEFGYKLGITNDFFTKALEYKNSVIATEDGKASVEAYYTSTMFQMLDQMCGPMNLPTSLELAMNENSLAGLKTQTTWTPEA